MLSTMLSTINDALRVQSANVGCIRQQPNVRIRRRRTGFLRGADYGWAHGFTVTQRLSTRITLRTRHIRHPSFRRGERPLGAHRRDPQTGGTAQRRRFAPLLRLQGAEAERPQEAPDPQMVPRHRRRVHRGRGRRVRLPVHHHRGTAAREIRARREDDRVLRGRHHDARIVRRAEPRDHRVQESARLCGQGDRGLRGPHVLHEQGHRSQGHRPRARQQHHQGHAPGRVDHHPAVCGTLLSGRNDQLHRQAPRGHPRGEDRAAAG